VAEAVLLPWLIATKYSPKSSRESAKSEKS
jgi:hypothetical protein